MNDSARRVPPRRLRARRFVAAMCAALTGALVLGPTGSSPAQAESTVRVVVQALPGAGQGVEQAVTRLGGHVDTALPIIDGFSATLPADRIGALEATPGVVAVTENRPVSFSGQYGEGSEGVGSGLLRPGDRGRRHRHGHQSRR
jgi:serine protease AprX